MKPNELNEWPHLPCSDKSMLHGIDIKAGEIAVKSSVSR